MTNRKHKALLCVFVSALLFLAAAFSLAACSENTSSSDTNNQTAGVDESDIVKVTDDGYIFKAQSDGLTVSKAADGDVDVIVKEAYKDFTPCEMFVTDSLLIVFGNEQVYVTDTAEIYYSYTTTISQVKIYDVNALKNNTAGYEIRTTAFNGTFYTARMFNNQIYVILHLKYYPYYSDAGINFFDDTYEGIKKFDMIYDLTEESQSSKSYSGFVAAKFDLDNISTSKITAKFFCGENISDLYCSPYALYAVSTYWVKNQNGGCGFSSRTEESKVSKISLEDLSLKNHFTFAGGILNRYSLYDNGHSFYMVGTYQRTHYVYAFDNKLRCVSKSEGFAYGETIRSVRFDADLCYVVTFRQVDPLFKIDISNPLSIKILGALKIEGFSSHLQIFGDYLIGLGFESTWDWGLKLTLFDTNGDEPVEINSIYFSVSYGSDSKSEATSNPKAILSEPGNNIFAFPVEYTRYGKTYQGAVVFGIIKGKIQELGFLTHYGEKESTRNVSKHITRITRIGDYLYTISDGYIASYSLSDFSQVGIFDTRIGY